MFYKIVASRGDSAYVEKLKSVKLVGECRVFCEPVHGSCYFAHIDQIIKDCDIAEIIHQSTDWLYKVRLEFVWGQDQDGDVQDPDDWHHRAKLKLSSVYGQSARGDD